MVVSSVMRLAGTAACVAVLFTQAGQAAGKMQFWNLTTVTIDELRLAPAGTGEYGPNQCLNDRDKSVDADERLKLTGIGAGSYDVKLKDVKGRVCTVKGVTVKDTGPYSFSISDKELTDCSH